MSQDKPHKCSQCSYSTSRAPNLKRHLERVHENPRERKKRPRKAIKTCTLRKSTCSLDPEKCRNSWIRT